MGCSGCGKARAELAAKMNEQARIREQKLAQLPPDKKLTVMPHIPAPLIQKTPRQLRIEARQIRMARRAARVARRIAAQKALEQPKL